MKSICIKTVNKDKVNFLIQQFEKLSIEVYISTYRFKTYDNVIIHYSGEDIEQFYDSTSNIIKNCIEKFNEQEFVMKNLKRNYFYLDDLEQEYICNITKKILELPDKKIGYKNKVLKGLIKEYIKDNKSIILEGFVNFRTKKYKEVLDEIIEVSVFSYLDLISY